MSDAERIDQLILALDRLVLAEQARRDERDKQRADLTKKVEGRPKELDAQIPKFDVNKIEAEQDEHRAKTETIQLKAIEREERHFALLERQIELLEAIASKLEAPQ